jgi:hypothetical protein
MLLSQSLIFLLGSFVLFLHFFSSREKISKEALFLVESSNYIAFMHTSTVGRGKRETESFPFLQFYYSFVDEAIAQKKHTTWYRMDQCSTQKKHINDRRESS